MGCAEEAEKYVRIRQEGIHPEKISLLWSQQEQKDHDRERNYQGNAETFSQIRTEEQDAKPLLNEIWQRSYLLRQISMDSYDFLHLSFQEYFTALELKEQSNGLNIISKHLSEPWWEEAYPSLCRDKK